MKPNPRFLGLSALFWAYVRLIPERIGYYIEDVPECRNPFSMDDIVRCLTTVSAKISLASSRIPDLSAGERIDYDPESKHLVHQGRVSSDDHADYLQFDPKHRVGWNKAIDQLLKRSNNIAWLRIDDVDGSAGPTKLGKQILRYLNYRQQALTRIESQLMTVGQARTLYGKIRRQHQSALVPPMNKQKGSKKRPAYLTAIVDILVDAHCGRFDFDRDPQQLTKIVRDDRLLRVLARRFDGAFPSAIAPIALWETKEYYDTTTFGSRIADCVYESLLDGMELEDLRRRDHVDVKHYLIVDAYNTWWSSGGRPYLCRIIDMLHMGYVDEVLFGREVVERLPVIVKEWVALARARCKAGSS
ncbi:MAG: hypothetical protein GY842_16800 [bacterium]|nr:hypothetical protein [bacterium]